MTTRYYEITECEHGMLCAHYPWKVEPGVIYGAGGGGRSDEDWCPGGQRRELTVDYEAAAHVLREKLSTNGFKMKPAKVRAGHWVPDIVHAALSGDPQ